MDDTDFEENFKNIPCTLDIVNGKVVMKVGKYTTSVTIPQNDEEAEAIFNTKPKSMTEEEAKEAILGTEDEQKEEQKEAKVETEKDIANMTKNLESLMSKLPTNSQDKEYQQLIEQFKTIAGEVLKSRTPAVESETVQEVTERETKQPLEGFPERSRSLLGKLQQTASRTMNRVP
jgi:microcompartment protein CcmL/EutN